LHIVLCCFTFEQQNTNKSTTKKQIEQSVNSMTTKELQTLKSKMPKGYRQKIREKTGLSVTMVDYVFMGIRQNQSVIIAALDILEEYEKEQAIFNARLQKALEPSNAQTL